MDFYLTSKSLKHIKESGFEDDFEIKIFDKTIHCSRFAASFLSRKISRILRSDPTLTKFTIDIPKNLILYSSVSELQNDIKETDFLTKLQKLVEGEPILIEKQNEKANNIIGKNTRLLFEIGNLLENDEMIDSSFSKLFESNSKEISETNFLEKLKVYRHLGNNKMGSKVIEFIAAHFYEIFKESDQKIEKLKSFNRDESERIFSSEKLKIESEDWLFDIVCSLGSEFFFLFDYIEIQYLSVEKVKKLIEMIDSDQVTVHNLLWSSICRRLIIDPYKNNEMNNPRVESDSIKCEQGIFQYLSEINKNSNIYSSKVINFKSSSYDDGDSVDSLFDHSKDTYYRVRNDDGGGYMIFDFQQKKINISKYYLSVPSAKRRATSGQPSTWRIEGSNDEQNWCLIDSKENDSSLNAYSKSNTFTCKNINNQFYQFIRFKPIKSCDNTNFLLLSEIEFYGSIKK